MSVWPTIVLVAVTTFAIKGVGPAVLGERELPPAFTRVVLLLAPALLTALVVTSAAADASRVHLGADTCGVAAAGLLLWRGLGLLPSVLVAVAVTAGLRLAGMS